VAPHILVVDDEPDLLELVRFNLSEGGYRVDCATSGSAALERIRKLRPDLVVLDLMLLDMSGIEVCRQLRADAELGAIPVIVLTAKAEEIDRVVGFEVGADDYVTKPFSPRELALRVRAVLRRQRPDEDTERALQSGGLRLDRAAHRCFVDGAEVVLTAKEFQLLDALMRRPGRVLTRDRLLNEVWGSDITVTARTIDTHMKRLREKLGQVGSLVETVRGVGYRFAET
jgi:two-component system, OmpR family, phosphate regulon response regulator PhoB